MIILCQRRACLRGGFSVSIDVPLRQLLRQLEGVLNQLALRFGFFRQQNFDYVEPKGHIGIVEHSQPGETAFGNAHLLLSTHCFDRPSKFLVTARFCFDESERLAVMADDVDVAAAPIFEIAEKNFVALIPQESTSQFFSARTGSEMFR